MVADEHNISVKERLCRATVTPVASSAIVLRTHSFIFPRYRRVVCATLFHTQRAHSADTTRVLQHPKNRHRLSERGILSKEEKWNLNANREGVHGQLAAANWRTGKPDTPVCWLQAVRLGIAPFLSNNPDIAGARKRNSANTP